MTARRWLVLFVKEPRMGRVKSRLARGIGAVRAAALYRRMSGRAIRLLSADPRWTTVLAVTPDGADAPEWAPVSLRMDQGRGDLGIRMRKAFAALPPGPAVIAGSDVPDVTPAHIWEAFRALGSADVVFGPGEDGGYWLVGMARRRPVPGFLEDVRWSTRHALADSRAGVPGHLRVAEVATLADIDTAEDLKKWGEGKVGRR
ncbi:MAG: TIGR04282 family arsenosugar biosynthesis glycosyltransferase [Alphaproteobacteria bacterium]